MGVEWREGGRGMKGVRVGREGAEGLEEEVGREGRGKGEGSE